MKNRRGFTLLEVLVATAIMGMAVAGLLSALSASMRHVGRLTDYERIAQVARAQMDTLLADTKLPRGMVMEQPFDPSSLGGAQGGWRARMTTFEGPPNAAPGIPVLERVELEIWWMSGDQRRTYVVEGYRRAVLKP